MQSRLLINLVLLITVVGLLLFLINTEKQNTETPARKVTVISADEISSIAINNISGREITFSKENDQWQMQTPFQAPAHPTRIKALLGILDSVSVHQLHANEIELNRFQLDPANQTLRLNDYEFRFGDVNPLDQTRYVLFEDEIHLIHDNLYQQLSTNPTFFINPKILPNKTIIKSIQTPDYTLKNDGEGWSIDSEKELSGDQVIELQKTWNELEANTIQELSFEEANNTIKLNLDDGSVIEYMIMPESESLILGRKDLGLQYHISEYNSNKLFPIEEEQEETNPE